MTHPVRDVTDSEVRPPALPEVVAGFVAAGCTEVARVVADDPLVVDAAYVRSDRPLLHRWRARPAAVVLVAPDPPTVVTVDTWGEAPDLRLLTTLDDGTLVETVGTSRSGAPARRAASDPWRRWSVAQAPGRSVRAFVEGDPPDLLALHEEHVHGESQRRGSAPVAPSGREDAVAVVTAAVAHAHRAGRALARWEVPLALTVVLVAAAVVTLAALLAAVAMTVDRLALRALVGTACLVVVAAGLLVATRLGLRALVRAQWWRPSYP